MTFPDTLDTWAVCQEPFSPLTLEQNININGRAAVCLSLHVTCSEVLISIIHSLHLKCINTRPSYVSLYFLGFSVLNVWLFSSTASVSQHCHTVLPLDEQSSPNPLSFLPTKAILSGSKPVSIHRTSTASFLLGTPPTQQWSWSLITVW